MGKSRYKNYPSSLPAVKKKLKVIVGCTIELLFKPDLAMIDIDEELTVSESQIRSLNSIECEIIYVNFG